MTKASGKKGTSRAINGVAAEHLSDAGSRALSERLCSHCLHGARNDARALTLGATLVAFLS
jgi:hypothetical protein